MDSSSKGADHEEEEGEPVATQFNTSNFGNFLEVQSEHSRCFCVPMHACSLA